MNKRVNDLRLRKLADTIVNYSCRLKKGEKILISINGYEAEPLLKLIIKEVYKVGGIPFVEIKSPSVEREILLNASKDQIIAHAEVEAKRMEMMDAYVGIGASPNSAELSDVPSEKQKLYDLFYYKPVHHNIRVGKTKWVVLRYPTYSMAQLSGKSFEAFEDYYFEVCNLDYNKLSNAMDNLKSLMEKTDRVHIGGIGTDLSFSIKDIPVIKCDGKYNLPDGEVYTAPVKNSVNGVITYTAPSEYRGTTFSNIELTFEQGKIVNATANYTERLNAIFDTDEGSRFIGEFAIGVNPFITEPMNNILFDEKITGSFHFTPGASYKDAYNGNESSVHWDLVCIQTPKYGGGEIYFDDVLIRKDGLFVHPELLCLNPNNF